MVIDNVSWRILSKCGLKLETAMAKYAPQKLLRRQSRDGVARRAKAIASDAGSGVS